MQVHKTSDMFCDYRNETILTPEYTEHYHNTCEIAFFIKADIKIFIKDILYEIKDGDIIFIDEYDVHRIIYNPNVKYTRYVLNFDKRFIRKLLKMFNVKNILEILFDKTYRKISLNLKQREDITAKMDQLVKLFKKSSSNKDIEINRALMALQIFVLLAAAAGYVKYRALLHTICPKEKLIKEIIGFIDANFMEPLKLDEIAAIFKINKYYLSHIFREQTGFSLFEYIQYRRIIEAQKMLKNPCSSIVEVCYDCGFTNIQHFYKVFKKITKLPPGKYKKSIKN